MFFAESHIIIENRAGLAESGAIGSPGTGLRHAKKGVAAMKSHPPAQRLSPSVSRSPLSARTAVLLHAALAACALLAACANTVNNHGGAVGSGGSASSGGTNTIQTTGGGYIRLRRHGA